MKIFRSLLLLTLLAVAATGCTLSTGQSQKTVDETMTGGVFRTVDQGVTWRQLGLIQTTASKKLHIFGVNTSVLVADPSDPKALYLGTFADGAFFSYDAGLSWQVMTSLGQKGIIDLAVDPKNKCVIYAAAVGRIFKTGDCGRTWQEIYSDNDKHLLIYSVVVDHFASANVYIANARGDVIKSEDSGKSWRTLKNLKGEVRKLVMDPRDSRTLLAAVYGKGLFRSTDAGVSWQDLTPKLKSVKADKSFRDLVAAPSTPGFYLLAVDYGLFKTANYGDDWTEINLIPPENRSRINALAVNPLDNKLIYYDTDTTLYSTVDGGQNWFSRKLPTARQGSKILASPLKDNPVYLGLKTN